MLAASAAAQENHWPVAIVGPFVRTVAGAGVTLAGEGADPDGDAVTYRWRQGDGPAVLALAGADTWTVTFTPAVAGVYTLVLTVFDGRGGSGWATERVVVRKAGVPRVTYVARARPGGGPAPDDRGEIWRASEDGSGATRLFASLVGDRRPAWSPDGLKAVFHSNITTTKGDLQQVDENGQNRVNLTSILSIDTEDAPCWEPDGSGLYFQTDLEDYATVHRMEPEGAKIYNVLRSKTAQDLHPSLSPCGKRMVTARQMAGGMSNLYVLDAAAAVESRLTSGPWRDAEPDWSPVGPRIVWESNRPGPPTSATTQVWIGDSDGSGQTCLTSGSVNRWPAWTADGTRIAFVSDRDGQCELYSMLPDGSDVRRLSSSTDVDEAHPCVEPAGAPANRAPVIFAGPTRVFAVNRPATLAASAYEPDGEAMTTSWQQVSGPATVVLTAPASLQATLTPSALGWYGFRFTAMDSRGAATASTVAVEVRPAAGPNTAPRVTLPFPGWMNGVVGQTLTLSPNVADPEGSPLTCSWRQVTPYPVALLGVTSSEARFTPTTNGLYDFELTARDPEGLTKSATQRVVVRADASVELTALVSGVVTNIGLDGVVKSVMDTSPLTDARPCDWTPDGSRLMLNATWEGRASLFEKTAGSGLAPQRRVTNCQSYTAEHERGATYSPDGKDFIYDAELPASHSYYPGRYPNLNSSGGWLTNEKSVSSHAGEWRFDGRRWFTFQCVEATNGTFQIRSSFWEKMASGNRSYGAGMRGGFGPRCFFASDQNRVLFASRDPTEPNGIRAIWRTKTLGLSAYNCERLTSGHFDTDAHALPDGSRIVFLSDRAYPGTTAVLEVFSAKPDGTDIQRVTYLNAPMSDLILRPAGPRPQRYPSVAIPPIPTALAPAPVTLAATAADLDGDALTYRWTLLDKPAGSLKSSADITPTTAITPAFTPDAEGYYTFALTASDGRGGTAIATGTLLAEYVVPEVREVRFTPNAGVFLLPQPVTVDVTLSAPVRANATTPTVDFERLEGTGALPSARLVPTGSRTFRHLLDLRDSSNNGTFRARVNAVSLSGRPVTTQDLGPLNTLTVDLLPPRDVVVAVDPVPAVTSSVTSVQLTARTSTPYGDPLTAVRWTLAIKPAASQRTGVDLAGSQTLTPTFSPDVDTTDLPYQLRVEVTDRRNNTGFAFVRIDVDRRPPRLESLRVPGSVTSFASQRVQATFSEALRVTTGTPSVAFALIQASEGYTRPVTGGPMTPIGGNTFVFDFVPHPANNGTYQPAFTFEDLAGNRVTTQPATIDANLRIDVSNRAPIVEILAPVEALVGRALALQANVSDPDGDAVTYRWSLAAAPGGALPATMPGLPSVSYTPAVTGTYVFELTVDDGKAGGSRTARAAVLARPDLSDLDPDTPEGALRRLGTAPVAATLSTSLDVDCFAFDATYGRVYSVEVSLQTTGEVPVVLLDPARAEVPQQRTVARQDAPGRLQDVRPRQAGTHYLRLGRGDAGVGYTVRVTWALDPLRSPPAVRLERTANQPFVEARLSTRGTPIPINSLEMLIEYDGAALEFLGARKGPAGAFFLESTAQFVAPFVNLSLQSTQPTTVPSDVLSVLEFRAPAGLRALRPFSVLRTAATNSLVTTVVYRPSADAGVGVGLIAGTGAAGKGQSPLDTWGEVQKGLASARPHAGETPAVPGSELGRPLRLRATDHWPLTTAVASTAGPALFPHPDDPDRMVPYLVLDGRASADGNRDARAVTYRWRQTVGPHVDLSDPASPVATFVPAELPDRGQARYAFELLADNGPLAAPPAQVEVSLERGGPQAPTAAPVVRNRRSGLRATPATLPLTAALNDVVELDGRESTDPQPEDRGRLAWRWRVVTAPGAVPPLVPAAASATPTFVARVPGLHEVELVVGDRSFVTTAQPLGLESRPQRVAVLVLTPSETVPRMQVSATAPTTTDVFGDLGDLPGLTGVRSLTVPPQGEFDLTASVDDVDVNSRRAQLAFSWTQLAGPPAQVAVQGASQGASPVSVLSGRASREGVMEFRCRARKLDFLGSPLGAEVSRNVRVRVESPANTLPVASIRVAAHKDARHGPIQKGSTPSGRAAVPDAHGGRVARGPRFHATSRAPTAVTSGTLVSLQGSASGVNAGRRVTYQWRQVSGPEVALSNPYSAVVTFVVPDPGAGREASVMLALYAESVGAVAPGVPEVKLRGEPDVVELLVRPLTAETRVRQASVEVSGALELLSFPLASSSQTPPDAGCLLTRTGARVLCRTVPATGGGAVFQSRLTSDVAEWPAGALDGYIVLGIPRDLTVTWSGPYWPADQFTRELPRGVQLLGVPAGISPTATAATLADLANSGWVAQTVSGPGRRAHLEVYFPDLGGLPFSLRAGHAVLLHTAGPVRVTLPRAPEP